MFESLRLHAISWQLPTGQTKSRCWARTEQAGIGRVEGWRGEVMVAPADAQGNLTACIRTIPPGRTGRPLEHAVIDNIVPDFPLINKSFNLSYSGQDL